MAQASPETPRHLRAGAALLPPRAVDSSSQFERLRSLGSAGSATGPASAPSRQASVYVVRRPPRPPGRASGTAASLQDAGCGASHSPPCVSENHGLPGRRRSAVSFSGDRTPCPHHPPGSQTLNQRGAAPFVSAGRRRGAAGEGPRRQELGACRAPRRLSPCSELRVSKGFSRLQVATQPRRTRAVQEICQQPPPGHRASPQPERSPRRAGGRQAAPGSVTASLRAPSRVGPALEARLSRGLSWGRGGHEEAPGGPCGWSLGRKRQVAPGGGVSAGAWSPISSRATESPLHGRRPGLRRGRARPGPASRAPTRLPRRRRLNAGRAAVLAGDDGLCSGPAASAGCPGPRRSHRSLD